jgi:hypothetical protein
MIYRMMNGNLARALLSAALCLLSVAPVDAQYLRAAAGGALGVAGGGVATLSVVVARARLQGEYIHTVDDLVHWQTAPMILGPALGVTFGLAGEEPFRGSVVGSAAGFALGTVVGAATGWVVSREREAPWAGAIIGAGLGMTAGGVVMGIQEWVRKDRERSGGAAALYVVRVPL